MTAVLDLDATISDPGRRILLFCGTGGVGKTSLSAAIAVRAADRGRRVAVMTIDPAKRLASALGVSGLDDEPTAVPGIDPANGGSLDAMMLDMKRTFDSAIAANASPANAAQLFQNRFYQSLSTSFSGTQEYMAMERLSQLYRQAMVDNRWDLLVVDTPPSRSALDFLDAPQRLSTLLDGKIVRLLTAPARSGLRLLGAGMDVAAGLVGKLIGTESLTDLKTFMIAFESVMGGFRQRAERTRATLASARSGFVLVATPERAALREARYFADRLATERLPLLGTVINRCASSSVGLTAQEADELARHLAPGSPEHAALTEQARVWREMDEQRKLVAKHLAAGHARVAVPHIGSEISDLDELRELGRLVAAKHLAP